MLPRVKEPWPRWWLRRGAFDPCIDLLQAFVEEFAAREPPAVGESQYLTDHGVGHVRRVLDRAEMLVSGKYTTTSLTAGDKATLYAAVLIHDIGLYTAAEQGNDVETIRRCHADLGAEWVRKNAQQCALDDDLARVIASIVAAHRRKSSLAEVDQYAHISLPEWADLKPRFLTALLRIADALDIGQSRAPTVFYRHYESALPLESSEHWAGYENVLNATLDLDYRQIVLHIRHAADPRDSHVRRVYRALQAEFDALDANWMRWMGAVDLSIVFEHQGKLLVPGSIFAAMVDERSGETEP